MTTYRVTAGQYMIELPANGVAILHVRDERGDFHQVPGGSGYLEALVQFAGEIIRLRAIHAGRIDELSEMLGDLVSQIDKNDFRDSLGHDAKMLKAFIEGRAILAKARGEPHEH